MAQCGFGIKKVELIETVERIVKDLGRKDMFRNGRPGQNWYAGFFKRHPEINIREPEGVNNARTKNQIVVCEFENVS